LVLFRIVVRANRACINALLLDPFYGVQGKFLKIFGIVRCNARAFAQARFLIIDSTDNVEHVPFPFDDAN
jgi:hypothetical protein